MSGTTEGGENPPDVSPTDQSVVDTAVAAGVAAGTAQVAANEASEAAVDAEEAQERVEVVWQFTVEMLAELTDRQTALEERIEALEAERHVSSSTETSTENAGEETPLQAEEPTTEAVHPSGDPEETVTIQHRRKFRKV